MCQCIQGYEKVCLFVFHEAAIIKWLLLHSSISVGTLNQTLYYRTLLQFFPQRSETVRQFVGHHHHASILSKEVFPSPTRKYSSHSAAAHKTPLIEEKCQSNNHSWLSHCSPARPLHRPRGVAVSPRVPSVTSCGGKDKGRR